MPKLLPVSRLPQSWPLVEAPSCELFSAPPSSSAPPIILGDFVQVVHLVHQLSVPRVVLLSVLPI